jgi:hypothetical protein
VLFSPLVHTPALRGTEDEGGGRTRTGLGGLACPARERYLPRNLVGYTHQVPVRIQTNATHPGTNPQLLLARGPAGKGPFCLPTAGNDGTSTRAGHKARDSGVAALTGVQDQAGFSWDAPPSARPLDPGPCLHVNIAPRWGLGTPPGATSPPVIVRHKAGHAMHHRVLGVSGNARVSAPASVALCRAHQDPVPGGDVAR